MIINLLIFSVIVNLLSHLCLLDNLREYDKKMVYFHISIAAIIFFTGYGILSIIGVIK